MTPTPGGWASPSRSSGNDPSPRFPWAGTASRKSSRGQRRFWCRAPRPISLEPPCRWMAAPSVASVSRTYAATGLTPSRDLRRHGRHHCLEELVCGPEAALVLLREVPLLVPLLVGRIVKFVLVFDVHGARVSHFGQHREKALPIHATLSGDAESPPANVVDGLNAGAPHHMPEDLGVLEVDVVNLAGEVARRLHRVHELPHQVRRVELQAHPRAVLEGLEQRFPSQRAGADVGTAGVRFPENAHLVFFA